MILKSAFTLIEAVIVVAIIALLAAILLPSLSLARKQARATVCMSNCKQIALAFIEYGVEYKGEYPRTGCAMARGLKPGQEDMISPTDYWLAVLSRYSKSDLLFRCPEDRAENFINWSGTDWDALSENQRQDISENKRWSSYVMNSWVAEEYKCLSDMRQGQYTILIAESAPTMKGVGHLHPNEDWIDEKTAKADLAHDRHRGMANYIYVDGHVARMRFEETWVLDHRNCWDPKNAPAWVADEGPAPPPPPP
jgi:prepilin-type processing-associated H-X9-DG protein/prepilin-type N-terminal cleavage/methylation domain-containing protein